MNNLFKYIYEKTLKRKEELNKHNGLIRITIDNTSLNKKDFIHFERELKIPAIGRTTVYVYHEIFRNIQINRRFPLIHEKVYPLLTFINLTKVFIQVSSNGVAIPPSQCSVYVTGHSHMVLIVNGDLTNVVVTVLKEITSINQFTGNYTVAVAPTSSPDLAYGYILTINGIPHYVEPTIQAGQYVLNISAGSNTGVLVLCPDIRSYKRTPMQNSQFNYIQLPVPLGYVALNNIRHYKVGTTTGVVPTEFTPLTDGFKVPDLDERIVVIYRRNVSKYEDLKHRYNLYRDYMSQFLSNTLPTAIKNHTPYLPNINENTPLATFNSEMVEASKDFYNVYREYLESKVAFQFTTHTVSYVIPITDSSFQYTIANMKRDPKELLFFNDGINTAPFKTNRLSNGQYQIYFNDNIIPTSPNCYSLNGTSGNITVPNYSAISLLGNMTIEFWIRRTGTVAGYETIISKRVSGGVCNYEVFLETGTKRIGFFSGGSIMTVNYAPPIGVFVHIAVATNSSGSTFYVNGEIVGTTIVPVGGQNTAPLTIGNMTTSQFLRADLKDIRLWDIDRSQNQIKAHMNYELKGNETSLRAYWKLTDTTSTIVNSVSGGLSGTASSGATSISSGVSLYKIPASIVSVDLGSTVEPYVESVKPETTTLVVGPSGKINDNIPIKVYETSTELMTGSLSGTIRDIVVGLDGYIYAVSTAGSNNLRKINPYTMATEVSVTVSTSPSSIMVLPDGNLLVGKASPYKISKYEPNNLTLVSESTEGDRIAQFMIPGNAGDFYVKGWTGADSYLHRVDANTFAILNSLTTFGSTIFSTVKGPNGKIFIGGTNKIWRLHPTTLAKEAENTETFGIYTQLVMSQMGDLYGIGSTTRDTFIKINSSTMVTQGISAAYDTLIADIMVGNDGNVYVCGGFPTARIAMYNPRTLAPEVWSGYYPYTLAAKRIIGGSDGTIYLAGGSTAVIRRFHPMTLTPAKKRKFTQLTPTTVENKGSIKQVTLASGDVGKNIHVTTTKFNKFICEPYSKNGLTELPTWASFISSNNIVAFIGGRLVPRERVYILNPFQYTILKGKTVLVTDLDTDVTTGETISVLLSSEVEMVEYNVALTAGSKIVTLTNKNYPFSTKYNLVFVDGKLIHPSNIQVIDSYRFSINVNSIHNMCILRKRVDFTYESSFYNLVDKWSAYLATLSVAEIESLLGVLNTVINVEDHRRTVNFADRHWFEILYEYCLKDRKELTIEDHIAIPEEIPNVLTSDGRIPISTYRTGSPRYKL